MALQEVPLLHRRLLSQGWLPSVGAITAGAFCAYRGNDLPSWFTFGCVLVLAGMWLALTRRRLRGRARAILVRTSGMCCLHCGYSLLGCPENGNCPECGRSYYADMLRAAWERAAGFT